MGLECKVAKNSISGFTFILRLGKVIIDKLLNELSLAAVFLRNKNVYFAQENIKKLPSKVTHNQPNFLTASYAAVLYVAF